MMMHLQIHTDTDTQTAMPPALHTKALLEEEEEAMGARRERRSRIYSKSNSQRSGVGLVMVVERRGVQTEVKTMKGVAGRGERGGGAAVARKRWEGWQC